MRKQWISLLLALALCLTLAAPVWAEEDPDTAPEAIVETPAEETEAPAEESAEEPTEEPAEGPSEEPVEEPAEEPVGEPAQPLDGESQADLQLAMRLLRFIVRLVTEKPEIGELPTEDAALIRQVVALVTADPAAHSGGPDDPGPTTPPEVPIPDAKELVSADFIDPIGGWDTYNELIAAIRAETDMEERADLLHRAEDIIMASGCIVPLYFYKDNDLQKGYLAGVRTNAYGVRNFAYAKLNNASDTLRVSLATEPETLDPGLLTSTDAASYAALSFSGLFGSDERGNTVPACAESYTVSEDGLTYTFTLRDGLKWSDGSALTAADFAYAWQRVVDAEADYSYLFEAVDGYPGTLNVQAVNDRTLRVVLAEPCAYIKELMGMPAFYPVKRAAVEASPDGWCAQAGFVSNGAYTCTGWEHDGSLTYEKNPYWYDADKVSVAKVVFSLAEDDLLQSYMSGGLDYLANVPVGELEGQSLGELREIYTLGVYYMTFRADSELFAGKTPEEAACMRLAVSLLIDRPSIVQKLGGGMAPAVAFVPEGVSDGNGGSFRFVGGYFSPYRIEEERDAVLEEARTLLKAAGYTFGADGKLSAETPLKLSYLVNNGGGHATIASAVREDLAALGIEFDVRALDWSQYRTAVTEGDYDICRGGWIADFNDPINFLDMWVSDAGMNDAHFGG